jgi:S-adenosylmethionine:tRNA ribosyltransferase-isomerase
VDRIAQQPLERRDASRMLLMERVSGNCQDRVFRKLPEILRGDELLVLNSARVIPARLFGRRKGVRSERPGRNPRVRGEFLQSQIEVLLARQVEPNIWEALVRPGRKVGIGEGLTFGDDELHAEVIARGAYGLRTLRFDGPTDLFSLIDRLGHTPLPPYIHRAAEAEDRQRYQTVFAKQPGAVAAPTAGLHFTPEILERIRRRGIPILEITLHIGLGTFQPLRGEEIEQHRMHGEAYEISAETAAALATGRREGRRLLAVGTTVVRALEDATAKGAQARGPSEPPAIAPGKATADIFIYPGFRFRIVDALLTNFHLPRTSLLALVSAFAEREHILLAYQHAISEGYRFYSYGDCMLIR